MLSINEYVARFKHFSYIHSSAIHNRHTDLSDGYWCRNDCKFIATYNDTNDQADSADSNRIDECEIEGSRNELSNARDGCGACQLDKTIKNGELTASIITPH